MKKGKETSTALGCLLSALPSPAPRSQFHHPHHLRRKQ